MNHLSRIILLVIVFSGAAIPRAVPGNETQETKTFTVNKGGTLELSISGGDIRITTWERSEVAVTFMHDREDDYGDVRVSQQGDTVRVTDHDAWGNGGGFDVMIPSAFNLDLETASGNILVKGRLTGNITAQTSAGDIMLDDVEGAVDTRTSGGNIKAGKITGKASLSTSGGEIEVASSMGELELRSSGGDLTVGNVGKSLRAQTAGGDVIIGDVGGGAFVSTAGGNVKVGKVSGEASLSTAGGDVELKGGSGTVRASTSGGNVILTNVSGSVEAGTAGGDIYAELVPNGKGRSKLSSAAGVIKLFVPEDAKATIDARIRIYGGWRGQSEVCDIRSDFKEESSARDRDEQEIRARYVLNGGGSNITLETVNSDIEVRKLKK
jgi:DUF4097 and DUF4098 domain-containing protein YvlB